MNKLMHRHKQVSTTCARDCYDTCALIVTLDESGQILSVKGDSKNPVTQGFVCPRGNKDHERIYKNRVNAPFIRREKQLERTDWDESLDAVAQNLRRVLEQHGPEAVLYLAYDGNTGLLTGIFPQRLWNAIGATQTDGALCSNSGHKGLALHYGNSYGIMPGELASMNLVTFWGFNAAVSSSHMWSLAQKARKSQGARIVVVDPRSSRTAKSADLWIQPRPGSDVALAYGVINDLIQSGSIDQDFIAEWTCGFEQLKAEASKWTPDRVERITGVPWKQVEQLAKAYGHLKPSATMIGIGLQKCDRGADQVRAVALIPALLGLRRGFFYSNGGFFSINKSLISGQALADKTAKKQIFGKIQTPALAVSRKMKDAAGVLGTHKIVSQVALADLVQRGEFKFIHISCMNPAMTLPNLRAFREGLSREDVFTVVHETHWTKTTQYADVVLPAPTYLEKDDLVIPWSHNHVQYSKRVVRPVTDSRTEIWVMREIARRLELAEDWLYTDPWEAVELALEDAFEEGDLDALKSGEMLRLKRKPKSHYSTPSGKIEFYSSQAAEMGFSPLPVQAPLHVKEGHLRLLTSATPKYTSTQFQEVYGAIPAIVMMNPQDAERLGVKDGHTVTLANDRGQVQMTATISDAVLEGVVWSPRQSEGVAGEPQNCLMSSEPQEIGSGPRFNSTTVIISR